MGAVGDSVAEPLTGILTLHPPICNFSYIMPKRPTITDVLRQAIEDSGLPFLTLEQQTGVLRQSLMKFARGEISLRLDAADKLAEFFNLELGPTSQPKRKGK